MKLGRCCGWSGSLLFTCVYISRDGDRQPNDRTSWLNFYKNGNNGYLLHHVLLHCPPADHRIWQIRTLLWRAIKIKGLKFK